VQLDDVLAGRSTRDRVIDPFEIASDDAVLDDLRRRLGLTRYPDRSQTPGGSTASPVDYPA